MIMSLRQTGVTLGGALAGLALSWLIVAGGWRVAALVFASVSVILALALQPLRARFDHPLARAAAAPANASDAWRLMWAHAELRRMSFSAFLLGGVQLSYASFWVVFLVSHAQFSVISAGARHQRRLCRNVCDAGCVGDGGRHFVFG